MKINFPSAYHLPKTLLFAFVTFISFLMVSEIFSQTAFRRNGKIAFTSSRDGNIEIYVMNADGSGQTRITNNSTYDLQPKWSPDGTRIAFVSARPGGGSAIFVMNADGTGRTEITSYHCGEGLNWSPDSQKISFADCADPNQGVGDIFIVNADGTGRRNLTADPADDYYPVWSPDGQRILFSKYGVYPPVGYGGTMLHTINLDGTDLKPLVDGFADGWNEDFVHWSRATNKIVYSVNRWDFVLNLYFANPDGTGRVYFHGCDWFDNSCRTDIAYPEFSPDGSKVAFTEIHFTTSTPSQVLVKNVNGTGLRLLANNASRPSWQPIASFAAAFDYDGDGRSDLSTQRGSNYRWYIADSNGGFADTQWGVEGDLSAPADYDGDGKTDVAIFRPSEGRWYVRMSQSQTFRTINWGENGDIPVPTDRDADGRADFVLFRPSNNTWYTRFANDTFSSTVFGEWGDRPVVGDFDADGKGDIAVYRPSNNNWYIIKSSLGFFVQTWGEPGDQPVTGDFDGDGSTDHAVFRPGTGQWYLSQTTAGFSVRNWGEAGDIPVAADYDGDGKTDVAVFRPSNNNWYIVNSTSGISVKQFGEAGDVPTQSAFCY